MPNKLRRVYWDSNVFLSFVEDHPDRASVIEALLSAADAEELVIVTSTITITEVAFAPEERDTMVLLNSVDDAINDLWRAPSPVKLVEFHPEIAHMAKELLRRALASGIKMLKPMDAIHLATALSLHVDEFHTYDEPLTRYADLFGLRIIPPFVQQTILDIVTPPKSGPGT